MRRICAKMTYIAGYIGLLLLGILFKTGRACTFPSGLIGDFFSTFRADTLKFNSTHVEDYKITNALGTDTFECHTKSNLKYVAKSLNRHDAFGVQLHAYVCLEITKISDNSFKYYIQTAKSVQNDNQPIMRSSSPPSVDDACNVTMPLEQYYMFVKIGPTNDSKRYLPPALQGTFNYTVGGSCSESHLETCGDRKKFKVNLTLCATKVAYSAGGDLDVLHYISHQGVYYISLYNLDSSGIDNVNYFQIVCVAATISGNKADATVRGLTCAPGQNSTHGGTQILTLHAETICPPLPTDPPPETVQASKNSAGTIMSSLKPLCTVIMVSFVHWFIKGNVLTRAGQVTS